MSCLPSIVSDLSSRGFTVLYGAAGEDCPGGTPDELRLPIPWLGGERQESVPPVRGDLLAGAEWFPLEDGRQLEEATREVYARVLGRTAGQSLCRIWNYVPEINTQTAGLENYRAFCRGRARAFEAAWGRGFAGRLAAASAVGGPPGGLAVIYAAAVGECVAVENPEQVPAYHYPPEHGPRPPSFSRATRARGAINDWVFISGTASIKGHRTVAPGELAPQIACTVDNLRLIAEACDLSSDLGRGQGWRRHFKIYLRRAADFAIARTALEQRLLQPGDEVIWLQADICRAELEIEIEAALARRR